MHFLVHVNDLETPYLALTSHMLDIHIIALVTWPDGSDYVE